jgi:hypothetical protein
MLVDSHSIDQVLAMATEYYPREAAPKMLSTSFGACCPFYSFVGMGQSVSAASRNYRAPDSFSDSAAASSPVSAARYVKIPRNLKHDSSTCCSPGNSA